MVTIDKKYSAVIPAHNEEDNIIPLLRSLESVLRTLGEPFEMIVVDDGSSDATLGKLKSAAAEMQELVVITLDGRKGKSAALQAGFDAARGEILITLDGDGQNDPEDIPRLLQKMKEDCDLVCGWRQRRQDPFLKKISSRAANTARRLILGEKIHDVGCCLRVFNRSVIKDLRLEGGEHRFFTALVTNQGFRVGEVQVRHHPRNSGHSKYGIWDRLTESFFDLWLIRKQGDCKK